MCMCSKPTINGEPGYSWDGKSTGIRPVDPPPVVDNKTILYDEPGRCGGQDSHSHHYRVVGSGHSFEMLVKHGGGVERFRLSNGKAVEVALASLDSNGRYWMLNALYHAASDAASNAREAVSSKWSKAAAEKRIKTRFDRGSRRIKVWIEDKPELRAATAE